MWVYNAAGSDTYPTLLNRATQATNNGFFWIYTTGTNEADLNFQYADGANFVSTTFSGALSTNTWQHVVFTFDNASKALKLYINGSQFSTTRTLTGSLPIDDGTLYLGTYNGTATNYSFLGYLDEVRIYTSALSAGGVTNLYQSSAKANVNASENSDLTSGLVGLWSFNGADVSGTTAYDRSGQGNNGTLTNGPTATAGKIGQALDFDGNDDYVDLGSSKTYIVTTAPFSVSFWMKADVFDSTQKTPIYLKTDSTTSWVGFQITDGSYNDFNFGNNSSSSFRFTYPSSPVNKWVYISITYNGSGFNTIGNYAAYVDGLPVSLNAGGTLGVIANTSYIGRDGLAGRSWDGSLDEVRIYNRALSATEIWNLYQAGGGAKLNSADSQSDALERGLAGYWKLDDGSGTSATDASTNGSTGTLTNGPTWTTGQIGGAVSFDGTDDYITEAGSSLYKFTSSFAFGGWFQPLADNDSREIAGFDSGSSDRYDLNIDNAGVESFGCRVRLTGGLLTATFTTTVVTGSWYNLYCSYDDSLKVVTLYVNGVKSATSSTGSGTLTDGGTGLQKFLVGRSTVASPQYWLSTIDEVRIYNRSLYPEEVAKLYKMTAPDNPDTGLKGYWSFNGPDVSGTTAYDRSGAGNNGTLTNGPTVTAGKIGQALSFNGTSQYVLKTSSSASLNITGNMTMSVWVYPKNVSGGEQTIFMRSTGSDTGQYSLNLQGSSGGKFAGYFWGINPYPLIVSSFVPSNNTWYQVSLVFTAGSNVKLYVNGVLDGTVATASSIGSYANQNFVIGAFKDSTLTQYFNGVIDEVRIYNRAFTQTEVTNLYNLGR